MNPLPRWLRLGSHAPRLSLLLLRWGIPRRALLFGPLSLGDDLLCTAVLREARQRGQPFSMFTAQAELFAGNADPLRLLPIDNYHVAAVRRLGGKVIQPYYLTTDPTHPDRDLFPPRHIIAEMCRLAGLRGTVTLRPYLHLTDAERTRGAIHTRQIAIQSSVAAAAIPYANKDWISGRFAEVARRLRPEIKLVQIGSRSDPALPVDTDLRGKTTPREAAAVLAGSVAFVGLEGFLAHLARAVECPSVVVFGGRSRPETFGYSCNRNLFGSVSCAPCGLRNSCAYSRQCLDIISSDDVIAAARDLLDRTPGPLATDTAEIS